MLSLKKIAIALVATAGLATFADTAEAQYYPQGYGYQYGYEQPRLTRKQIAKLRARQEARRERMARRQFLANQRRQPTYYYEESYPQPNPYIRQQVIVQPPQQYYYPQQQYVPPARQYYPQQQYVPQYLPPRRDGTSRYNAPNSGVNQTQGRDAN
jgi:hypothetical protein